MEDSTYQFLSTLEKKVYAWLVERKIPFTIQQKMFGIGELGSATIDFVFSDRRLAWRVMGGYWHSTMEAKARDLLGKEKLMEIGYTVIDLQEEDLADDRIDRTLELALEGMEVP